jgi:hypothetical protein
VFSAVVVSVEAFSFQLLMLRNVWGEAIRVPQAHQVQKRRKEAGLQAVA